MPRRDEEKRIAFLRTLSVEDLANRRITEHSSEVEKRMVHDARDAMKEKNDARYMKRHKKKAAVDVVKTQVNGIGRRAQTEIFGKEGGLTGGVVGSWLLGGTLVGGTIVGGIATRGKLGMAAGISKTIGRHTRARISLLNKAHLSNKDTDAFIGILKRAKKGNLSQDDRVWINKKAVFYENRAKNSLPFGKNGSNGNPNPSPQAGQPAATDMPPAQPAQSAGNPSRTNPNMAAMSPAQKDALSKLKNGKRITQEEYGLLRQLKTEGKLTKTQQSLLTARQRLMKSKRLTKAENAESAPAPQPQAAVPTTEITAKYPDADLQSMLSKGGKLPNDFPVYPDAIRQLRFASTKPDFLLKKDGDYREQVDGFAREIAGVAKQSPLPDQENICLWLSHKITQMNRPIENFGRSLYDKALAILNEGKEIAGEIKKKVTP